VARDPDAIQREIEQTRDALAETLDALSKRARPKRLVDGGKEAAQAKLADPKVRFALIGLAVLIVLLILRKLFR
jgi:Protein of unknown function (DUF3618)